MFGFGNTALMISNKEMHDVMKKISVLKDLGY